MYWRSCFGDRLIVFGQLQQTAALFIGIPSLLVLPSVVLTGSLIHYLRSSNNRVQEMSPTSDGVVPQMNKMLG